MKVMEKHFGGSRMTKVVYSTGLMEVTKLRLRCKRCGTVVEFPHGTTRDFSHCINCHSPMEARFKNAYDRITEAFRIMHEETMFLRKKGEDTFELEFETEKDN